MEIRRLIEEHGAVPSSRQLQRMLLAAGIKAGHVTVMADLKVMYLAPTICPQRGEVREEDADAIVWRAEGAALSGRIRERSREGVCTSLIAKETEQPHSSVSGIRNSRRS
jgi:hypothetical protein